MSTAILLDTLFGVIALLFVPIGLRRGVVREVFTTAAVLTGAQLSTSWARPWGDDLAGELSLRTGIGQFAVSALFLIGTTLILGYGGAAALRTPDASPWQRVTGALLAVINGALLTAYLLRDIERFLTDAGTERALEKNRIARTLLHDFGWVVIASTLVMLSTVLVSLVVGHRAEPRLPARTAGEFDTYRPAVAANVRKPRLAWGDDGGKIEPSARAFDAANGRYGADAPSLQQTMPIASVDASAWSADRLRPREVLHEREWLEISGSQHGTWPSHVATTQSTRQTARCLTCGEQMTDDDMFCPRCGRARQAT